MSKLPEGKGVTLLGSFKYKAHMDLVAEGLEKQGIPVLAPPRGAVIGETQNFRMLQVDATHMDPVEAEFGYLKAAFSSKLVYVVNPHGYLGKHGATELGMITSSGIPVYAQEKLSLTIEPEHPTWQFLVETLKVKTIDEVVHMYKTDQLDLAGYELFIASQRRNHSEDQIRRNARMIVSVCSYD